MESSATKKLRAGRPRKARRGGETGGAGSSAAAPTAAAPTAAGATAGASAARASAAGEALNDDDVCIICASPIRYAALLPCNHRVCHVCAMRQRALYRKQACLVCRTECPRIVITEQLERAFSDFGGALARHDAAHAVDFTSAHAYDDTMRLLAHDCGVCGRALELFAALLEHVREAHHRYFCGICAANRKAFVCELALFTLKQLQRHQSEGDEHGFAGHPECKHCRGRRFYSDDELNVHVRDCHERCHICDQRDPRGAAYYKNYDALFAHFGRAHYVCTVALCLEKKFVVFREELDLTAHMLKEHGGLGGRAVVGAAPRYRLQLSTFEHPLARAAAPADAADSADTQRKRLEERARHYLNYDADKVRQFLLLNKRLRARAVTPRDLLAGYRALFANTTQGDLLLLVHEVAELLPESADRRELAAIANELAAAETAADKFPRLNGATLSTASIHAWGRLLPGVERFPALPKAKPPAKVVAKQPIRYTTVVKAQPRVTTAAAPAAYKPTYLDRLRLASELPVLGRSLPDPKFPTLPKKAAKKPLLVFEPVAPAPWGPRSGSSSPREPSADLDFGVPVVVKKKKGKK